MPEKKTRNISQKALIRRIKSLKISEEKKAEAVKMTESIFELINAK